MSLDTLTTYLNKPFPFLENRQQRLIAVVLVSMFIFVFLFVFQPFGIAGITEHKFEILLGYSAITFTILFISFLIFPEFFPEYFDTWTIKKNLIFIFSHFIIISISNWAFNHSYHQEETRHTLSYFIFITVSIGVFPTFLVIYFVEKWLSNSNEEIASTINNEMYSSSDEVEETRLQDVEIEIISKNKNENLNILLRNLLCIKSEGNYIEVFFIQDEKTKSVLIRNSISVIEKHLAEIPGILRCHRSYLANFNKIDHVSGNAHSLVLHFNELPETIPVSRSFPKEQLKRYRL